MTSLGFAPLRRDAHTLVDRGAVASVFSLLSRSTRLAISHQQLAKFITIQKSVLENEVHVRPLHAISPSKGDSRSVLLQNFLKTLRNPLNICKCSDLQKVLLEFSVTWQEGAETTVRISLGWAALAVSTALLMLSARGCLAHFSQPALLTCGRPPT